MTEKRMSLFGALFMGLRALGWMVTLVVNLLLLVVLLLFLGLFFSSEAPMVPRSAALVVAPRGEIVEQLDGDVLSRSLDGLFGTVVAQTLLRDLVDAIELGRDDKRVKALLLDLNGMGGASLSQLETLATAITSFAEQGKPVIAAADAYSQSRYYLAAHANEVYLPSLGLVFIEGFSHYQNFYKQGIDRLGADWNIFRVGEYKGAVDPFLSTGMSGETKNANRAWLNDLWNSYAGVVAAARHLEPGAIHDYVATYTERLRQTGGQAAEVALTAGLVDHVAGRDAVRDRLIQVVGEDRDRHSFRKVSHDDYLLAMADQRPQEQASDEQVGILVAQGMILDGSHPPGTVGGDSTAAMIRQARYDEGIKALVVRVDSGGGSTFASDVIHRELVLTREAGKPVVVSMGGAAASGGYWIATASDEIWASPTTVTGSIGIFAMFPTFEKPLAEFLGITVDGVGTTPFAGALRPDRDLSEEVHDAIQLLTDQGYEIFLDRVAASRDMSRDEVDDLAQGRVWSGAEAHRLGLVDRIGGLDEAVASAAALAGLEEGYGIHYVEEELTLQQELVSALLAKSAAWLRSTHRRPSSLPPQVEILGRLTERLQQIASFNDPKGVYAYCWCEVR